MGSSITTSATLALIWVLVFLLKLAFLALIKVTGAEVDALWGCFRMYRANSGPVRKSANVLHELIFCQLDYYVILGDGTLPSVLTEYARLVSPAGPTSAFAASPSLPPLSQFGYLSSSLTLAAEAHAQESIIQFLKDCRIHGFPVDGLYLSSGWCQGKLFRRAMFT